MTIEVVESEWVPVPEDLEPGLYVVKHEIENGADYGFDRKALDGWEFSQWVGSESPKRLLAVNGKIVRFS
jgi:hypothetical protein